MAKDGVRPYASWRAMLACEGGRNPVNGRLEGYELGEMLAWAVAEIGGVNLVGLLHLRIGTWNGAELRKRVAEN